MYDYFEAPTKYSRSYNSEAFKNLLNDRPVMVYVGGLSVRLGDMADAGWSLRIIHNKYGGRSKVSLTSQDNRSMIMFRVPGMYRNDINADHDFNLLRLVGKGSLTSIPKPLEKEKTDQELLEQVDANIRQRLQERPKKRKIIRTEQFLTILAETA